MAVALGAPPEGFALLPVGLPAAAACCLAGAGFGAARLATEAIATQGQNYVGP